MSLAFNGSSAIPRFKDSDVIIICDEITFDFYTGLPHMVTAIYGLGGGEGGGGAYARDKNTSARLYPKNVGGAYAQGGGVFVGHYSNERIKSHKSACTILSKSE